MATPSKPEPHWVFSEAIHEVHTLDMKMRVAIRSDNGWVKVLDLTTDGWTQAIHPTKRQILENIHHNITIQLAELTLEET
jgi:hypothetical protein